MRLPNGYGSVIKLGGKRRRPFAVRITAGFVEAGIKNGIMQYKQKYNYIGYFEKRKEALELLAAYNTNPYDLKKSTITFSELFLEWKERKFEKISASTIMTYDTVYKKCSALYDVPFCQLKTDDLQQIIDENRELTMIYSFKYMFSQLFRYAIKKEIVEKNLADFLDMPPKKDSAPRVPFSKDEVDFLWMNVHIDYVDVVLILLYSGLRISELLELKNENIHLDDRYLFIEKSKTKAGIRNVPIHSRIAPLIAARLDPSNVYFLPNRKGQATSYNSFLKSQYYRLRKKLKLNHTIHEARHSFITQCDRLALNEVSIKRIVGHANVNITQHYTAKNLEDLLSAIDSFEY